MKTLEELYCEENHCAPQEFSRRVFWACLYRHAVVFVPILGGYRSKYFSPERGLISAVGTAVRRGQIQSNIVDYFADLGNQRWLKRRFNLRISTRRLVHLARHYLPDSESKPPAQQ